MRGSWQERGGRAALVFLVLALALAGLTTDAAAQAQRPASALAEEDAGVRASVDRLRAVPEAALLVRTAPALEPAAEAGPALAQPVARRAGVPQMIAGGALFLAGLVIGGDAGTVMAIAGAGIGAYGLYLYFR